MERRITVDITLRYMRSAEMMNFVLVFTNKNHTRYLITTPAPTTHPHTPKPCGRCGLGAARQALLLSAVADPGRQGELGLDGT